MSKCIQITVKHIDEINQLIKILGQFIFRGQGSRYWTLTTSIERLNNRFNSKSTTFMKSNESNILNNFKQRSHFYLNLLPRQNDNISWLAMIQHYGGPTRLLDFTYSLYVAMYFAIESTPDEKTDCTIWSVNNNLINSEATSPNHYRTTNNLIADESAISKPEVMLIQPKHINERINIQQGLFLFPNVITYPFSTCLCSSLNIKEQKFRELYTKDRNKTFDKQIESNLNTYALIKINLPATTHIHFLNYLQKMNITTATLFPGIDGYTRSLKHLLIPNIL